MAAEGYGVILAATLTLVVLAGGFSLVTPWAWAAAAVVWLWAISFFRDPERQTPGLPGVLYAPADGTVTEVCELPEHRHIAGPCFRIRIFLSIFNVHVNRMPCAASVGSIEFTPGKFLNAMNARSAEVNESNTIVLRPDPLWGGPIVVRQISGLIARTIVCRVQVGDVLNSGDRFGMIKFGSGTEVLVPKQDGLIVQVQTGAQVRAGVTELARMRPSQAPALPGDS